MPVLRAYGMTVKHSHFIIREHAGLPSKTASPRKLAGKVETGQVYELSVKLLDEHGAEVILRRISVRLKTKTRDGDREIHILTNLPKAIKATKIAELYRGRWKIETAFQDLTTHLNSEINALGYPPAAIFGFSVALVTYNMLSVIKATIEHVHGAETVENNVSGYYLAAEISTTFEGLMIAVTTEELFPFREMSSREVAKFLIQLAQMMRLSKYKKHKRGPKKPVKIKPGNHPPHVSTAKLLRGRKTSSLSP